MNAQERKRAGDSIVGALVADAASLGMHWVYSQRRIIDLAPDEPEFRQPDEADFEGGVGYFAHATKRSGDLSQYGEQMRVMLRSLSANQGHYNKAHYTEQFRRHFGYGGEYVGYIDRPTRQTLDRIYGDENIAIEAVNAIPYAGNPRDKPAMLTKVLAAVKQYEGQGLRDRVEWYADAMPEPERSREYGLLLVDALDMPDDFPGAIDEQLPAVSKLPPLVACHLGDPDLEKISQSAIRVTNNAPRALDFGRVCTRLLQASIKGASINDALATATEVASDATQLLLNNTLDSKVSVRELSRDLGLHCDLGAGVPSLMYNLKGSSGYVQAIRDNIYTGGDNCGRAIVLGAVCGAHYGIDGPTGIPSSWVNRLNCLDEVESLLDGLFAFEAS